MITRETDYAMRICIFLSRPQVVKDVVSSADVAKATGVPYRFLRKIVRGLVASGLVESMRGRGGGLKLAHAPEQLSLLHIVQATGAEGMTLSSCLVPESQCPRISFCRAHQELSALQKLVDQRLSELTMDHLVDD